MRFPKTTILILVYSLQLFNVTIEPSIELWISDRSTANWKPAFAAYEIRKPTITFGKLPILSHQPPWPQTLHKKLPEKTMVEKKANPMLLAVKPPLLRPQMLT
ncbi:unnamed protein product [Periconia digitata]|uniref:Uncharacterized protein n=1 Tax=Periconia digitata TaxID=1303443 RepID=A0A9W4XWX0_9PLEO|nr:unnamed protein product [Periconia digitata]